MATNREIVEDAAPVMDIMGNLILQGHIVAYSKQGSRGFYIGIVTRLVKHGEKVRATMVNGAWWSYNHQLSYGINGSIVILNDPLYSLESQSINSLLAQIDSRIGFKEGEVFKKRTYTAWGGEQKTIEYYVKRDEEIPADYDFGNPWADEQVIFGKINRKKKKRK